MNVYFVRKLNAPTSAPVVRAIQIMRDVLEHYPELKELHDDAHIEQDDLVVAVGGDGTMLEAMRLAARDGALACGVNLGHVGFLTELSAESAVQLHDRFTRILTKTNTKINTRTLLKVTTGGEVSVAVNDVSMSPLYADEMISYDLMVDGYHAGAHKANSLLISTSTGSTAYNLSAGGALMMPNVGALQITPVAPMCLTSRPIITSRNSVIHAKAYGNNFAVRVDGQWMFNTDVKNTRDNPHEVRIETYEKPCNMIHLEEWNYFQVLNDKLGWIMK